jgi:hypothetical protein
MNTPFEAHQFTDAWKENEVLKNLCKKYKGDEYLVNDTKQRVSIGDYVLVSEGTVLVVHEDFLKKNFVDEFLHITVTTTEEGRAVAVSLQNEEHQIKELLWEADEEEETAPAPKKKKQEKNEESEEDVTAQIKRIMLRNEAIEIFSNDDQLLEKRIEKVKKLVLENGHDMSREVIAYMKESFDIDLDDLFIKHQPPKREKGKLVPANKKVAKHNNVKPIHPHLVQKWTEGVMRCRFELFN